MSEQRKTIRVTYFKSIIGAPKDQKETVRSLGFHRLYQTLEKPDNPSVRGMVNKVRHLVRIEEDESE
ncbi:MAG TPA: 50S ribosomal protein L30 [Thermomicrobiaceae bacterium]|nr:50S ribosomal protein L30 [Thermomicrobiaceae bacterium]